MMLALWMVVTFLRPCLTAYSKAYRMTRAEFSAVTIFMLSTTPGTLCKKCRNSSKQFYILMRSDLVFQHGIFSLGVLADEHHIDVLVASLDSGEGLAVDHIDVEVELITQTHVTGRNATTQASSLDVACMGTF